MERFVNIFGYSGHAYVVLDIMLSCGYSPNGYFDKLPSPLNPFNLSYLGDENKVDVLSHFAGTFGFACIGNANIRSKIIEFLDFNHIESIILTSPSADVSPLTFIKPHTFISKNVSILPMVGIGKGCIINTGATVEHECKIGDYTHIAPGAVLCGNVNIGNYTHVGANSIVKEGITIGNNIIIGAGTVVVKDITQEGTVWVGNPAKKLNR